MTTTPRFTPCSASGSRFVLHIRFEPSLEYPILTTLWNGSVKTKAKYSNKGKAGERKRIRYRLTPRPCFCTSPCSSHFRESLEYPIDPTGPLARGHAAQRSVITP